MSEVDEQTIRHVTRLLRGTEGAVLRFIGSSPDYENEFVELVMSLGVSARVERQAAVAPPPSRRISCSFRGKLALLTVDPSRPLGW